MWATERIFAFTQNDMGRPWEDKAPPAFLINSVQTGPGNNAVA